MVRRVLPTPPRTRTLKGELEELRTEIHELRQLLRSKVLVRSDGDDPRSDGSKG